MLQLAVVSRLPMLHGTADLMLLVLLAWTLQEGVRGVWFWALLAGVMATMVSALPLGMPLFGYIATAGLALLLRRVVWQTPIMAMLVATFTATLIYHGMSLAALALTGSGLPLSESLTLITLPSMLLNLLLALPVYIVITDLAHWIYPVEIA